MIEIQDQLEAYQASVDNVGVRDNNHERKRNCDQEGFLKKSKISSVIVDRPHDKLNLDNKPSLFENHSDDSGFMSD